jgi:hypothetical protein
MIGSFSFRGETLENVPKRLRPREGGTEASANATHAAVCTWYGCVTLLSTLCSGWKGRSEQQREQQGVSSASQRETGGHYLPLASAYWCFDKAVLLCFHLLFCPHIHTMLSAGISMPMQGLQSSLLRALLTELSEYTARWAKPNL